MEIKINYEEVKKMANYVPNKIKIGGKWYRAAEEATGSLNFKDDLNYHGSTTQIEYTAQKPNPVLHPSLYHVFDKSGSKIGEFSSDPQISCSGQISEIDIDIGGSDNSNDYVTPPKRHFPKKEESSGCIGWAFAILGFLIAGLWLSNWGGRIGIILGAIFTIIIVVTGSAADPLNGILIGVFGTVIFGAVGALIGVIVKGIKKLAKK